MNVEFGPVLLFYEIIAQNMIDVAMRIQQHADIELVILDVICQFLFFVVVITSWIYNDTLIGLIRNDISILLKSIKNK